MRVENQPQSKRPYVDLFIVSFLVLFLELACIRWFAAYVVFLTFFTNVILLASFLGMSVGCLAASRKANMIQAVPGLMLVAVISAAVTIALYASYEKMAIDVGNQASPQQIFFGTEYRPPDVSKIVIPMEAICGYFFVVVSLIFVGIGQVLGRRFDMIENRIGAYTTNIFGSLVGIAVFAMISLLWLPPVVWFLIAFACVFYFLLRQRRRMLIANVGCMVLVLVFVAALGASKGVALLVKAVAPSQEQNFEQQEFYWSPYYWIIYNPADQSIMTNKIGHQGMHSTRQGGVAYALPHLLNAAAGRPPFKDVLIIGAGSGNDVAAALWAGAEHVDAVEIDPVIYDIGRRLHPDHPYDDPRVEVHVNDGRNFLREGARQYDLILYAHLDSLIMHSGYSSLRLENYLFTEQALEDVEARLKDNGVFVMCNYFRQGWLVGRLRNMTARAFGSEPIVIPLPYSDEILATKRSAGEHCFAMLIAGDTAKLRREFDNKGAYWVRWTGNEADPVLSEFSRTPGPSVREDLGWQKIAPAPVQESAQEKIIPCDNWPFTYLESHLVPGLTVRGMAVIGVLSLVILAIFAPKKTMRFNWTMFFLGAGFMLLETKSVVQLALLFGSTWIVNSIVFFAILVMILLANLYVLRARPKRLAFFYAALVVSLVVNVFFNVNALLGMTEMAKSVLACLVVFLPIFFAGVIFASLFRQSANPDMDMGSNIAGVVLGGLAENFSMVLGFNHLLWIAIGFYLLARLLKGRVFQRVAV
jgi:hypothetical protein